MLRRAPTKIRENMSCVLFGAAFSRLFIRPRSVPVSKVLARLKNFLRDEQGPTAVEYAVMLSLLVVACITAISTLGA
jgi:pilus assembly protein Flp/PilA